ncbi:general substrate transporter [Aspergillus candidus]|uniref:General substrate transporter n=1 Tax=Aspergillus candidus TaxID=41067 RepID=A0A2I2FPN5_ASPCN|nr:general substrate transporter [Aspergillus candidus]PLB42582.1 general substrate transporter [Aspergillus candidus]
MGKSQEKSRSIVETRSLRGADAPQTSLINILVVATACLGGFVYGFAANALSGSLSQPTFIAKFLTTPDVTSRQDGMLAGFLGGAFVGSIIQAPLANKFGRRIANAVSAVIVIISGALQAGAVNVEMFIVFRVVCGIGSGMIFANTPVYMSEVSPPHTRGMLVGLHGVGVVTAYIMAAICALAFSFVTAEVQWRLVFIVLTAVGVIYLVSLYFIPESPRWLMEQGRDEEAIRILEYLHQTKDDQRATFAHAEARQIKAQVEVEKNSPSGYMHIIRTASHRKRALCSILLWTMGQATGITAIANLVPTLMGGLGFDTTMQLGLGVVWTLCAIIGCGINVLLLDRVGRVKLLVAGGLGSATILSIMAALQKYYLGGTDKPGINASVALYFIFGAYFTSTIECTAYVYSSEIWPTHLRSEGSTIAFASFFANAVAYSAPITLALKNIGWKYFMVFVAVTVVTSIMIHFYFPETMGLSLEEINVKFGDSVEMDLQDALSTEGSTPEPTNQA